ncbi:MAG: transporter, partial [Limisphaerales bacterium]
MWTSTQSSAVGQSQRKRGTGDLTTRLKINLWGNDGGPTAMAIMPFVTFPTGAQSIGQERTTGGVILPFAMELEKGWSLGAQTEVDWVEDEGNGLDT